MCCTSFGERVNGVFHLTDMIFHGLLRCSARVRNVFRAYWSFSRVWSLMAEYATEASMTYDAVVLARPDVWFHADIDLPT